MDSAIRLRSEENEDVYKRQICGSEGLFIRGGLLSEELLHFLVAVSYTHLGYILRFIGRFFSSTSTFGLSVSPRGLIGRTLRFPPPAVYKTLEHALSLIGLGLRISACFWPVLYLCSSLRCKEPFSVVFSFGALSLSLIHI